MNKNSKIVFFLIGGCIGITLMGISYVVANFLMGNMSQQIIDFARIMFFTFLLGGICGSIAAFSLNKLKYKDLTSKNRQDILKKQMRTIAVIILIFVGILAVYIIKKFTLGIILGLSSIITFLLWEYGCLLAYLNLKNNMAMIKK